MSSPDIAGILVHSKDLDRLRKDQEQVLLEIKRVHNKLKSTPEVVEKPGDNTLSRLKILYTQAKELSESEVAIANQLLGQLDAVIPPRPPGKQRRRIEGEQKKKRMKVDSDSAKIPQAVRNPLDALASLEGEQVAARVTQEGAERDVWFVVKVIHFDRETKEFEVLDEEPIIDAPGQRNYKLPMSHIIPFPKKSDPYSAEDFLCGRHVLAVYPRTTFLHKATVVQTRKRKADYYYELEFEGDEDEEDGSLPPRRVPFYEVLPLPEGHRQ